MRTNLPKQTVVTAFWPWAISVLRVPQCSYSGRKSNQPRILSLPACCLRCVMKKHLCFIKTQYIHFSKPGEEQKPLLKHINLGSHITFNRSCPKHGSSRLASATPNSGLHMTHSLPLTACGPNCSVSRSSAHL